jgi:large subunit ribosomal protein L3
MNGILGKKVGMTQIYAPDGRVIPVTILKAGPCVVVQRKNAERDGYDAVQLGLVEERRSRKTTSAVKGHFAKAGLEATRRTAEFDLADGFEANPGDEVRLNIFQLDDYVDIVGTSKGKGFQGVIKRHGFSGGRASHGSMFHRAPGSIGQSSDPSRVYPGMRATGHMGARRVTAKNLQIVRIDEGENLLFIRGAVPGGRNGYVQIRRAKRG